MNSEHRTHNAESDAPKKAERGFGLTFSAVFAVFGAYHAIHGKSTTLLFLALSVLMLVLALVFPRTLTTPNKLWAQFGVILGSVMTPIIAGIMYVTIFIPLGIFMKFVLRRFKELSIDKEAKSYWKNREQNEQSMKDQF